MRYYEMLFIVHPNYELDRLDAVISSVQKEISSKGAKILKTDNWGKRKLSYLINKQRYGSYVLMYFEAEPAMIQGLYEWMEIQSQILHQMVIRLEEKPELTEDSQNPDSTPSRSADPVKAAPAKEEKAAKVETAPVEEVKEDVVEESASAEATADVSEVVEEVEEAAVEEAATAEAPVEEVVEAPVEEEVAEEATEEDKESASAEDTADKKGE